MDQTALEILASHRVMAISTVRPDGWPQTTFVGFANDGPDIFFTIFRDSQKFANIAAEPRVSIAIGEEPADLRLARALYASGVAEELTDTDERKRAWDILKHSHPNLMGSAIPDPDVAAIMLIKGQHFSILDYTKGLGHTEAYDVY